MAILDLNDPISMLRLRCGDVYDLPRLPDEVYQKVLADNKGNMKAAAVFCAQLILAQLAFDSQQKLGMVEVYGNQVFSQYLTYLQTVIKDPSFSSISPIPYSGSNGTCPVIEFKKDWDRAYHECCHKTWGKL